MREIDLQLPDGRSLHAYDTSDGGAAARLTIFWHHGTPNIGAPPAPLLMFTAPRCATSELVVMSSAISRKASSLINFGPVVWPRGGAGCG